jgi:hypothetical protein
MSRESGRDDQSRRSNDNYGQCVELAVVSKVGGVRDTNQIPESP